LTTNCWHWRMPSLLPVHTLRSSHITLVLLAGRVACKARYFQSLNSRRSISFARSTCWGSHIALSVQPSNTESPTPMYHNDTLLCIMFTNSTPQGAFPLLCFWRTDEFARFSECQNQSVKKTPFSMYISHHKWFPKGLSAYRRTVQK